MHIGKHIKEVVEQSETTVVSFARALNCSRTNVYKIFERSTIDTELLRRISVILDYDFFADISEELHEE